MGKKRRSFSREFKLEAVKLVKEGGVKVAQASRDLGIYETSIAAGSSNTRPITGKVRRAR